MPTVSVNKELLLKSLSKSYSDEEFDELCFQFGIEVDDIVEEEDGSVSYKIEVGANRYDLLCLEGISRALGVYLQQSAAPRYRLSDVRPDRQQRIIVKPATKQVRGVVVGAVLRGMTFTQAVYDSFIALQDKLHQNIARKRTLVAIGTHDLATIVGPFTYDARPPADISFVPLAQTKQWRADELLEHYLGDLQLREYVPIIKDSPVYPVITDSAGTVLSLPPIINGRHSRITLDTKDVFIECTATDSFKAQIVLDTVVCMFSQYCAEPFVVEPVQVFYEETGVTEQYPVLEHKPLPVSVEYCNSLVGISETADSVAKMLGRMGVAAEKTDEDTVLVTVPPTRYDILHACDVAEDLAVAYGFDKLVKDAPLPPTLTIGAEDPLNYHSDKMRQLLALNAYTEAATFALCSRADLTTKLGSETSLLPMVTVGNPKTVDCEAVRTSLLPGILRTACANKHLPLPLRLFEVADVVLKDSDPLATRGTGARNVRHLACLNYSTKPQVELIQATLESVLTGLRVADDEWSLEAKEHPAFLAGFSARVLVRGRALGWLGALHPRSLAAYRLNCPAAALELDLQALLGLEAQPF